MKTYLKIINPIMALIVLVFCLLAAAFDKGHFEPEGILQGGVPTYFFAKGLFCSSILFILGKMLLVMISNTENHKK